MDLVVEFLSAYWKEIVVGIIVFIVGGLALNYVSSLLTKAKAISEPVKKFLFERECEKCNGRGLLPCTECKGSGVIQREVAEKGVCSSCKGSGVITIYPP